MNLFVQNDLKGENYVVRIEWMAIGEFYSLAQFQLPVKPVVRDFPRFGQRRFGRKDAG